VAAVAANSTSPAEAGRIDVSARANPGRQAAWTLSDINLTVGDINLTVDTLRIQARSRGRRYW